MNACKKGKQSVTGALKACMKLSNIKIQMKQSLTEETSRVAPSKQDILFIQ